MGYLRKAWFREVPVSISLLIASSSLVIFGFSLPRATMSNDCNRGTPALIMVESWRVNKAMSFGLMVLPALTRRFFILSTRMPWRCKVLRTTASDAARISPWAGRFCLSTPCQTNMKVLTSFSVLRDETLLALRVGRRLEEELEAVAMLMIPVRVIEYQANELFVGYTKNLFEGSGALHDFS